MFELSRLFQLGFETLQRGVAFFHLPPLLAVVVSTAVVGFLIFNFIAATATVLVWLERKVSARMQARLGPMYVGPFQGIFQTVADAVKLLLKEDVIPSDADPWVHRIAPLLTFVPAFLCFATLPFGSKLVAVDLDVGLLYILALSSLSVLGVLIGGWGSGNKFSMLGGLRASAQMVSYEIPRLLSIVPLLLLYGTMKLSVIVEAQSATGWFIFRGYGIGFFSFLIFLTASVAETNRTPFDLPEAESELVAGFHTEYSGMKFSMFFLAEYAYVFLSSALVTILYLGGGAGPLFPSWVWFLLKSYAIVFLFLWFRWTFPRLRVDRLMQMCWKFLLPWSLVLILAMGWLVARR